MTKRELTFLDGELSALSFVLETIKGDEVDAAEWARDFKLKIIRGLETEIQNRQQLRVTEVK